MNALRRRQRKGDWILERPDFFDPQVRVALPRFATDEGYARLPNRQSKEKAA